MKCIVSISNLRNITSVDQINTQQKLQILMSQLADWYCVCMLPDSHPQQVARVTACNSNGRSYVATKLLQIEHLVKCCSNNAFCYTACAVPMLYTIFSISGKLHLVSNFVELHPPTIAGHSPRTLAPN